MTERIGGAVRVITLETDLSAREGRIPLGEDSSYRSRLEFIIDNEDIASTTSSGGLPDKSVGISEIPH